MCIPTLSPEMLLAMLENDLVHWDLAVSGDPDLQAEIVACDLYEHAGYLRRFGRPIPSAVATLLQDGRVFAKALACLEESVGLMDERILQFMMTDTSTGDERRDRTETLLLDRDRWEVMIHTMTTREPELSRRLSSVWSRFGRIDERMHGRLVDFLSAAPWLRSFRELFGDENLDRVRYWWFYEIPELMASDDDFVILPYNCIDAVRFPPYVLADYLGDVLSPAEKAAFEEHFRICDACRTAARDGQADLNDPNVPWPEPR